MKRYRQFIIRYNRYVVFMEGDKAYSRRLYENSDGTYFFRFKNEKVAVNESQLYF